MSNLYSRRRFIKTAAIATAGASLTMQCPPKTNLVPQHIGVQLWSVREDMKNDPGGTLAAIAKMGYKEVEPFGYDGGKLFGMSYSDFHKALKDNGLSMPSTHCGVRLEHWNTPAKDIADAVKKNIDAAAGLGIRYVICPYMDKAERPQIAQLIRIYQTMAQYCQQAGVRFAYHNHDFEFLERGPDNRLLIDWILQDVDPALLAMQMDIYWVHHAKHSPTDWIQRHPGRWKLCHAKDQANTAKGESIEVGDGVIDFKSIFQNSKEAGLEYYVIELEDY